MSKKIGADYVFDPMSSETEKTIWTITTGVGVDVVFEVAGTEDSMNLATRILKSCSLQLGNGASVPAN